MEAAGLGEKCYTQVTAIS